MSFSASISTLGLFIVLLRGDDDIADRCTSAGMVDTAAQGGDMECATLSSVRPRRALGQRRGFGWRMAKPMRASSWIPRITDALSASPYRVVITERSPFKVVVCTKGSH